MTERINRRELILETAAALFVRHGYSATSVRQIADEVGCTEAALYYHFKEGKRELFREIVENNMPDLLQVVEHCQQAESLQEVVRLFGAEMCRVAPMKSDRFRWLIAEFPRLDADERALLHQHYMVFYHALTELIARFVPKADAPGLTWLLAVSHMGYAQLFINLDLQSVCSFEVTQLSALIGQLFKTVYPENAPPALLPDVPDSA